MVLASNPVASVIRLAARPVGAQSSSLTPLAARMRRIELTIVVLPTPGPPVITSTLDRSARRIAVHLALGERQAGLLLDPGHRLVGVDIGPGQLAVRPALQPLGDDLLGPVEPGQKDARGLADRVGDDGALGQFEVERGQDQILGDLEQARPRAAAVRQSAGRNGLRRSLRSARSEMPARTRIMAVFSMPSFMAIASAVLKPMPRMSRASR